MHCMLPTQRKINVITPLRPGLAKKTLATCHFWSQLATLRGSFRLGELRCTLFSVIGPVIPGTGVACTQSGGIPKRAALHKFLFGCFPPA